MSSRIHVYTTECVGTRRRTLAPGLPPRPIAVVEALRNDRFRHLHSRATLAELVDVLARPWLQEKYGVQSQDLEAFLKIVLLRGEEVSLTREIRIKRAGRSVFGSLFGHRAFSPISRICSKWLSRCRRVAA